MYIYTIACANTRRGISKSPPSYSTTIFLRHKRSAHFLMYLELAGESTLSCCISLERLEFGGFEYFVQ